MKKYITLLSLIIVWFTCVGQTVETIEFTKSLQTKTIEVDPIDFGFLSYNGYLNEIKPYFYDGEWDMKCSNSMENYLLAAFVITMAQENEIEFETELRTMTSISFYFDFDWNNPDDKKFYHSILWLLHPEYTIQELQKL